MTEMLLPVVGMTVRSKSEVDRYPSFLLEQGRTGVVVHSDEAEIRVRMDDPVLGCEEWNNEVYCMSGLFWKPGTRQEMSATELFWLEFERF